MASGLQKREQNAAGVDVAVVDALEQPVLAADTSWAGVAVWECFERVGS